MFNDDSYCISICKTAPLRASLKYHSETVGHTELKPNGKWYVYINDLDLSNRIAHCHSLDIGTFVTFASALAALWKSRFDTIAEFSCSASLIHK